MKDRFYAKVQISEDGGMKVTPKELANDIGWMSGREDEVSIDGVDTFENGSVVIYGIELDTNRRFEASYTLNEIFYSGFFGDEDEDDEQEDK